MLIANPISSLRISKSGLATEYSWHHHETQIVTFRWMPSFIRGLDSILMNNLTSTSKFLSLVLRHRPGIISMQLDPEGGG